MQPTWHWQEHQTQSPLEPAAARRAAHGTTNAAEAEASAALVTTSGPQQRLASLVLERSPDARSDGSYSSTTFVPDYRFGRKDSTHSQALDTEEAEVEEAAVPAPQVAGQADLSAELKPKVLPQPAQKPPASNHGEAGESSQAPLAAEAQAATPTLDDKVLSAIAKAERTAYIIEHKRQSFKVVESLSDGKKHRDFVQKHLDFEKEQIEVLSRRLDRETQELRALQAEQAGTTEQTHAG